MTISNGSTIDKADLDALLTAGMTKIIADRQRAPHGYHLSFSFRNLVASTPQAARTKRFVIPRDCYLEAMALTASDSSGETISADLTGDGALANFPVGLSGTVTIGLSSVSRKFYDSTITKDLDRAFRLLNQGSTCTLLVSTTETSVNTQVTVTLVLRQFLGR